MHARREFVGAPFRDLLHPDPGRAGPSIKLVLGEANFTDYELTARARTETVVRHTTRRPSLRSRPQAAGGCSPPPTMSPKNASALRERRRSLQQANRARASSWPTCRTKSAPRWARHHLRFSQLMLRDQDITPRQCQYLGSPSTGRRRTSPSP